MGTKKTTKETDNFDLCLLFGLSGFLIGGIALATVLTLYLGQESCASESTTITTETTSTTTTVTTTTETTTSTTTTTTSTTATTSTTTTSTTQTVAQNATSAQYYCGRTSSYTLWQLYSASGLYMDIDSSACGFNSTPLYFTSVSGTSSHWDLTGYTAIYSSTKNSFRVYTQSISGAASSSLLSLAQTYGWNVEWIGVSL
ncbi:unnamed protein product [Rotaria sp. Silwood1]|nr:unnamed protein product [Rotaria sp. Silwood1]CAF3902807.1 unnamed protein product [Rotaria sp. Silwood1]CAF3915424.1 unnamed protein product [Rotaria sp. Silwood1]CAF4811253.1 unnamed protein product [Rotaria sp. Silwood1]CAF4856086.1 unnamed protein product [Rotaria sp. Silwood1]